MGIDKNYEIWRIMFAVNETDEDNLRFQIGSKDNGYQLHLDDLDFDRVRISMLNSKDLSGEIQVYCDISSLEENLRIFFESLGL